MTTSEKVLAAMVSIGCRDHLTKYSFNRFYKWASKYGYTCILIKHPLVSNDTYPHNNKLVIPHAYPNFDKYVICDDDLFINKNAPPLPNIPEGYVGLVRDVVQYNTKLDFVKWTGNTGLIVTDKLGSELLDMALEQGDVPDVWPGFADQSALNYTAWKMGKICELDGRWNYAPVLDFFHRNSDWHRWCKNRTYRLSYYLGIKTGLRYKSLNLIKNAYGVHLIRAPYPDFFNSIVP